MSTHNLPGRIRTTGSAEIGYELNRKRVYILPTRHGVVFGVVLLVMLLGSVNYNNSLGFMLTFLLGSLALVAILHTYKNLAGLTLSLTPGPPVFAGERARFNLQLDNSAREARFRISITYPDTDDKVQVITTNVAADQIVNLALPMSAVTRGWLQFPRLTIATRFPLGLLRAWSYFDSGRRVLVYPRATGIRTLPYGGSRLEAYGQSRGGGNDDFHGLREYVPGDSSRLIHWKAEARGHATAIKQFAGASPSQVTLSWAEVAAASVEAKLSQLALWVVEAERHGIAYSMQLPTLSHSTGRGAAQRSRCLHDLALYALSDG